MNAEPPPRPGGPRPSGRGQKSMIWLAGAALFGLAWLNNSRLAPGQHGQLWPLGVAIAAFMYLWWLGSVLFDLVFIWHRYIQGDGAHKFLREHVQREDQSVKGRPLDPPPASSTLGTRPVEPVGTTPVTQPAAEKAEDPADLILVEDAQPAVLQEKAPWVGPGARRFDREAPPRNEERQELGQ